MLASDADLDLCVQQGLLTVTPTEPELLQPASIDLRLDHRFYTYRSPLEYAISNGADPLEMLHPVTHVDPAQDAGDLLADHEVAFGQPFVLDPLSFALGATVERVEIGDKIAAKVEGKSSLGRLGLQVHLTAGWIDPGFSGHITLELFNATPYPMRLWPGMKIAQLAVYGLNSPCRRPYGTGGLNSRYQNQPAGPQNSQGWRNFRTWPTRQENVRA